MAIFGHMPSAPSNLELVCVCVCATSLIPVNSHSLSAMPPSDDDYSYEEEKVRMIAREKAACQRTYNRLAFLKPEEWA